MKPLFVILAAGVFFVWTATAWMGGYYQCKDEMMTAFDQVVQQESYAHGAFSPGRKRPITVKEALKLKAKD